MKINYLVIPGYAIFIGWLGSQFTDEGLRGWYQSINLPSWTPPGAVIGLVWTTIYILTAASALIVWSKRNSRNRDLGTANKLIFTLFVINGGLNAFWSYLFFKAHELALAVFEAGLLGLTVYILMYLIWPKSKTAALLLLPYALWVTFATFLTYTVWSLNQ